MILKRNIICLGAVLFGSISSTTSASWSEVESTFQNNEGLDAAVLIVGDKFRGRLFTSTKGDITPSSQLRITSLSKWITGGVILKLYEQGIVESLQDNPQKYLDWWSNSTDDQRSQVTVQQLLSFTSGFSGQPTSDNKAPKCVTNGNTTIEACAQQIYRDWFAFEPGTTYYYGPSHHHILGAIAEAVTGLPWADVFSKYLAVPLGMTNTLYTLPSLSNPRLSGGAISSADDIEQFLWGLLERGENADWGPGLLDLMAIDNTPTENVTVGYSAFRTTSFHYGLSVWLECAESSWEECESRDIVSATGGLGFHAYIDRSNDSYGILAYEGQVGIAALIALQAVRSLRPLANNALIDESSRTTSPTVVEQSMAPTSLPSRRPLANNTLIIESSPTASPTVVGQSMYPTSLPLLHPVGQPTAMTSFPSLYPLSNNTLIVESSPATSPTVAEQSMAPTSSPSLRPLANNIVESSPATPPTVAEQSMAPSSLPLDGSSTVRSSSIKQEGLYVFIPFVLSTLYFIINQ